MMVAFEANPVRFIRELPRRARRQSASADDQQCRDVETLVWLQNTAVSSSVVVIGVAGVVCSCLCGRWRFDAPREVRLAFFQEGRKRLFCVFRADLHTELFVLSLHRRLDLLKKWPLHKPLAGL